jgi:serine protease AprX
MTPGKKIKSRFGWRWLTAAGMAISLLAGIVVCDNAKAESIVKPHNGAARTALGKYTWDITAAAEQGRFDSFDERRNETEQAIQILSNAERNNPVVLSDSPAIRDLVTLGIARRMARNDIPETLYGKRLLKLNLDLLFHDSPTSAELVQTLSAILSEAKQSETKFILVIDPVQALVGSSAAFDGAASNLMREAIRNGDVQCLGTSTDIAFQENVNSDQTLSPLFAGVEMQEAATADSSKSEDAKGDDSANSSGEEFVGDNVSSDLRELIDGGHAPARVQAILQVDSANSTELRAELARYGVKINGQMPQFGAIAVDAPAKAIEKLAANTSTRYLSLDRQVTSLGHLENTTGETAMWAQSGNSGFDGSGVGIAILDSGISPKTAGLDGIALNQDFTGERITSDPYGHGTFVASIAAGNKGSYGGIAPSATLINFRVLNSEGMGTTSGLLAALNAVAVNRTKYNIRVVNMSLGMPAIDSYKNDPICRAVRSLVNSGIVVVAAGGNDGKDANGERIYGRIHSPGNEPSAITVGAVNTYGTDVRSDDGMATYSSHGPTRSYWTDAAGVKHYDNLIKPDLAAPGNKIVSRTSPNNSLLSSNSSLVVRGKSDLMRLSGTSVASPAVAGTAAVLLEVNPNLTPNMIKMILMYTAQPLAGFNMLEQGAGELNIEGAVRLAKLMRKDLSSSTQVGAPLLTSSAPVPQSTIAGQTFKWSQGVLFNYDWATGSELITRYQAVYGLGILIGDGVVMADARGVLIADGRGVLIADASKLSGGVLIGDNILISKGITMSDGVVLISCGILIGDGVLFSDGILIGDGVLTSDGILVADARSVLIADARGVLIADGILIADKTACMSEE